MKTLSIDFEYNNSNEKKVGVVCCCTILREPFTGVILDERKWWLYNTNSTEFVSYIKDMIENKVIFLSHFASAEVRCLLNYFEPIYLLQNLKVLDTFVLWKQLEKDPDIAFGVRFENGNKVVSTAPYFTKDGERVLDEAKEYGNFDNDDEQYNNDKTYYRSAKGKISKASLVEVVANQLHIDMNSKHKDEMRDLILNNTTYTNEEQEQIMDYCLQDIVHLYPLACEMLNKFPDTTTLEEQVKICEWMISSAIVESNGFPVEIDKFLNFSSQVADIKNELMRKCNEVYPFFINNTKNYEQYAKLIDSYNIVNYPLTASGKYKSDKNTLKSYWSYPEIKQLYETTTALSELRYFNNSQKIRNNVGTDNRCRVMTSPFGTITTRNAPSVSQGWFLAMSTWMRSLVSHPDLYGCDYSAQEVSIMGQIAKDENLNNAYADGDPYSWFAKQAAMCPLDANVKKDYRDIRTLCKALMLGLGFGMGVKSLANHLTASRIDGLTDEEKLIINESKKNKELEQQANDILDRIKIYGTDEVGIPKKNKSKYYKDLYYTIFSNVKKYSKNIKTKYENDGYLKLKDGWTIQKFKGAGTIGNFEIQGNAQVVLRQAVKLCILNGIEVVATLHDAIYIIKHSEEDTNKLELCMRQAVIDIFGDDYIRVETDNYCTDWVNLESKWTKDRGGKMLKDFGSYFLPKPIIKEEPLDSFWD